MFRNYLTIALRNLRKSPGFTFLNIAGLAAALACCLLIGLYVHDELSYDRHLADAERTYRVTMEVETEGDVQAFAGASATLAPALLADQPQVTAATRLTSVGGSTTTVRVGDTRFYEQGLFRADASFFDFFGFPLLQGDPTTALAEPRTVVLTQSMARKYFGSDDPLGRVLLIDETEATVTGVMADVPPNTHVRPRFLLPLEDWADGGLMRTWHVNSFHTYIKLAEGVDPAAFEADIRDLAYRYVGDELAGNDQTYAYQLQPVTDIHLHSDLRYELEANSSAATVYTFGIIAVFILLIACVNFTNLTTARSLRRAKEVGVRKTAGAQRRQLTIQFLGESVLMSVLAMLGAVVLAHLLLPLFNDLAGKALSLYPLVSPSVWLTLVALAVVTGLLAGSYPALVLSSFRPAAVLKGGFTANHRGRGLRKGLVVFQFTISVVLIICTLVVSQQLRFMKNQRLGFDKEQVVVVPVRTGTNPTYETLRAELGQVPGVRQLSLSTDLLGRSIDSTPVRNEAGRELHMQVMYVDEQFLSIYRIPLVAGRNFSSDIPLDVQRNAFLLNETAVTALGWDSPEDAIGREVEHFAEGTVIGVFEDFHYQSLHQEIGPLMLMVRPGPFLYASLKLTPGQTAETLAALQARFQALFPNRPFDYFFLDEDFDRQYAAEEQLGQLTTVFSFLAVLIACLGLFGLAAYAAEQRTKEIGVRKVLGASVAGLVALLSKDFLQLVLIAIVVAVPLAVLVLNQYLGTYPYRIALPVWVVVVAGGLALLIAFLTVSYQAIKASMIDPVKALRYE